MSQQRLTIGEIEAYLRENPDNFTYQRLYAEATGHGQEMAVIDKASLHDVTLERWQEWLDECNRHIKGKCQAGGVPCPKHQYYEEKAMWVSDEIDRLNKELVLRNPYLRTVLDLDGEIERLENAIDHREERIRNTNHGRGYKFDHMFLEQHQEKLAMLQERVQKTIAELESR